SDYEQEYGRPVDVSVTDLEEHVGAYHNRAVRVRGRLEMGAGLRSSCVLRDSFGAGAALVPVTEIRAYFERESASMVGQEVEVVGLARDIDSKDLPESDRTDPRTRDPGAPRVAILF